MGLTIFTGVLSCLFMTVFHGNAIKHWHCIQMGWDSNPQPLGRYTGSSEMQPTWQKTTKDHDKKLALLHVYTWVPPPLGKVNREQSLCKLFNRAFSVEGGTNGKEEGHKWPRAKLGPWFASLCCKGGIQGMVTSSGWAGRKANLQCVLNSFETAHCQGYCLVA